MSEKQKTWAENLADLLRAIRPEHGAPGTRDVDVTAAQRQIDAALVLLDGGPVTLAGMPVVVDESLAPGEFEIRPEGRVRPLEAFATVAEWANQGLPPLPHPAMPHGSIDYFSAGQMRHYARLAIGYAQHAAIQAAIPPAVRTFTVPADEREAAERAYTSNAFNYERGPVGSHDWRFYHAGWKARAILSAKRDIRLAAGADLDAIAKERGCEPRRHAEADAAFRERIQEHPDDALVIALMLKATGEDYDEADAWKLRLFAQYMGAR